MTDPSPPAWRLVVAFVAAPVVPSLAVAFGGPFQGSPSEMLLWILIRFVYSLIGASALTVGLGLPVFAILFRRVRPTAVPCALVGAAIAALPFLVFKAAVHGYPWAPAGSFGALGALGGLSFWAVATSRRTPSRVA